MLFFFFFKEIDLIQIKCVLQFISIWICQIWNKFIILIIKIILIYHVYFKFGNYVWNFLVEIQIARPFLFQEKLYTGLAIKRSDVLILCETNHFELFATTAQIISELTNNNVWNKYGRLLFKLCFFLFLILIFCLLYVYY